MATASTRLQIVTRALSIAGRGNEIKTLTEEMLNDILRGLSLEFKWPELRKFGSTITLTLGADTVALPTDFGAGMDNLQFSDDNIMLDEKDGDEFVHLRSPFNVLDGNTFPRFYMVDQVASIFRFERKADKNYTFTPIYFHTPTEITVGTAGDSTKPWYRDDRSLIEMLILAIYEFNVDDREQGQFQKVEAMKAQIKRGLISATGGGRKITLARDVFRPKGLRNRTRLR